MYLGCVLNIQIHQGGEGLKRKMHFTCLIIQSQRPRTSHFLFYAEVSGRDFVKLIYLDPEVKIIMFWNSNMV